MNDRFCLSALKSVCALVIALAPQFVFANAAYDSAVIREGGTFNETPTEVKDVGIDEQLGAQVDRNLQFKDESGKEVTLGKYINGSKPLILSLAYFNCPGLCNFHLNGMTEALRDSKLKTNKDYEYLVVSFDSRETPQLAAAKKQSYLRLLGDQKADSSWHFLTGDEKAIAALTKEVGFKFKWDKAANDFAHASAAIILTPDGKVSRYLPGITFEPKTLKLAVLEASNGTVGTVVDRFVLYCFHYDPKQTKYVVAVMRVLRIAAALTVLILALFIAPYWWRQRRKIGAGV